MIFEGQKFMISPLHPVVLGGLWHTVTLATLSKPKEKKKLKHSRVFMLYDKASYTRGWVGHFLYSGVMEVYFHVFLTSALVGWGWLVSFWNESQYSLDIGPYSWSRRGGGWESRPTDP
jgi:hypothetical protein